MALGVRVITSSGADFTPSIGSGMGSCPVQGPQSDCRTRYQLLLSGRALAERYRRIYTTAISDKEQGISQGRGKKALNKKKLKRRQKVKSKVKSRTKPRRTEPGQGALRDSTPQSHCQYLCKHKVKKASLLISSFI
uniref:Uncharacterized protein n=1 Tax=Knipowitschia caucasica TaxID=637954 RepID=A0AAV2K2Z5_KNICA